VAPFLQFSEPVFCVVYSFVPKRWKWQSNREEGEGQRRRSVAEWRHCEPCCSSYSRQTRDQSVIMPLWTESAGWQLKGGNTVPPHRLYHFCSQGLTPPTRDPAGEKAVDARPCQARFVGSDMKVSPRAVMELGSATRRTGEERSSLTTAPTAHASPTVKYWTI
jgi:hypothetical protein